MFRKLLLVVGLALVATPALASCPPYVDTCRQARVDDEMRQNIAVRACVKEAACVGSLLIVKNEVYMVKAAPLRSSRYDVTPRMARNMIAASGARLVMEGDADWMKVAVRYLTATSR